jgi:hypothetical protein
MSANQPSPITPILYQPSYEVEEKEEAETRAGLLAALQKISETTYEDSGHAIRSVHAKSHGLLRAEVRVLDGLPPMLAQGVFAAPASYPAVIRVSTIPGDILDDSVSTPLGMALKLVGVPGERLPGSEGDITQDFIGVNAPTFSTPGPKKFLGSLKLLAATTDKAPGFKKLLSAAFRGTEKVVEALGGESATLKTLGGHPETHPLGETFYSQAPLLFGPYMAKVAIVPVSPALVALKDAPLNVNGKPEGLRQAFIDYFASHGAEWEIRVQLCTDLDKMPVEDASVEWPEELSPYLPVARITAPPQAGWSEALSRAIDDKMSFSPWHGVAAHRPIGSIMRVRKAAYEMSSAFRARHNGVVLIEPMSESDLPPL